jgi:hypothetical protein
MTTPVTPEELADRIADYVMTHRDAATFTARDGAYEAVILILTTPGACDEAWAILNAQLGKMP